MTAGVASAQNTLKAEVPFAFHVGSNVMEPGTIRVQMINGINGNHATRRKQLRCETQLHCAAEAGRRRTQELGGERSAEVGLRLQLGSLRPGEGSGTAKVTPTSFHGPKTKSGETLLTEIVMTPDRGN